MCMGLLHISKYIGQEKSHKYVLPEIVELIDDEEGEVVAEAIIQYQKHIDQAFSDEFKHT